MKTHEPQPGYVTFLGAVALIEEMTGYSFAVRTIHDWRRVGRRGVKLQARLIGRQYFTRRQWIEEFFEATTDAANRTAADRGIAKAREVDQAAAYPIDGLTKKRLRDQGIL